MEGLSMTHEGCVRAQPHPGVVYRDGSTPPDDQKDAKLDAIRRIVNVIAQHRVRRDEPWVGRNGLTLMDVLSAALANDAEAGLMFQDALKKHLEGDEIDAVGRDERTEAEREIALYGSESAETMDITPEPASVASTPQSAPIPATSEDSEDEESVLGW